VGSCSAIIAQYFQDASIDPKANVASALVYGIFMDTSDLTRGASSLDIDMFYWLYSRADISLISQLKGSELSLDDLHDYARAFESVEVYGDLGFLPLENGNDSLLGAASDIVTSVAGVNVVVSYATRETGVKYSTRSISPDVSAADLVRAIVDGYGIGGGHDTMAGGFIKRDQLPKGRGIDTFTRVRAIEFIESLNHD
jgi:nanoRNase/pAp phosphatase (c-di-AMP/oligoRNAs hydrolase)